MKTIIEMAREAFKFPDAMVWDAWMPSLERFATLVEAAHTERLLAGVEMPEAALPKGIGVSASFHIDYFTANQLRETVAAAVLRKDAEMRQMGEDLIAIQTMHNEQKARLYEKCADLRNERDALKAENERLRADAARYRWLRRTQVELSLSNDTVAGLARDVNELDAAMKGQS